MPAIESTDCTVVSGSSKVADATKASSTAVAKAARERKEAKPGYGQF